MESAQHRNEWSRRELLTRTGAVGLALATTGIADAEEKPRLILGSGEHQYECLHDWLSHPDSIQWGDTQGLALDSRGRIYITHTVHAESASRDAIVVFDKNGRFLNSWGSRFDGGGHGIEIRKEGGAEYAYHCDTRNRQVVKTTLNGKEVWTKGTPKEPGVYNDKMPFVPTNIAFSPNGDFYIADGYGSHWIHQYDIKGNYLRTFGGPGKEPGKFLTPHGIWLDTRGSEPLLAITDRSNARMQYFTLDGKFVKLFTDGMRLPCYYDTQGDLLLNADLKSVVSLLDKDNKVVELLGDGASLGELRGQPRNKYIPGKFIHPHAAKFLPNGDILVAEWLNIGRITLLKKVRS